MLKQTLTPWQIILWLSQEQFPSRESIPESLRQLEGDIFKIRLVEGDLRSHKKYYYVSKEYPEDFIFLIDDDIYYPTNLLQKVWAAHLDNPKSVISNFGYHLSYKNDGKIDLYSKRKTCYKKSDEDDLFFGSGGGTLIHPIEMHRDLTNIELAYSLTPTADDVWLNAMTRLSGFKIHMIKHGSFLPVEQSSNIRLANINNGESQNDVQIAAVENYYGKVFSL